MAGTAKRWTAVSVLALTTLAGCGGDSGPSAEERAANKKRWVERADAACRKANTAIAERGWPADLVDLDRLVVRGIDDARAAIRSISGLQLPEGGGPRPGRFVRELKALDPELEKLSAASEDFEPAALVEAAEALKPRLATIEKAADESGLHDCMSHDERFFIPDAVRAPVFAEQFARLDRKVLRRIKNVDFATASTPGEFAVAFDNYSEIIDAAVDGIDRLDPPLWAAEQTANYQRALRDLQSVSQKFTALLVQDKGKPLYALDRGKYLRMQKEVNRTSRAEIRTRRKMLRAVGAGPTNAIPDDETVEPEDEQVS